MSETPSPAKTQKRARSDEASAALLGDFRTDRRMLLLSALAVPIGVMGALVAKALLWLIAIVTNLSFFHRFSAQTGLPEQNHLGWWLLAISVAGGLVIGLIARFGSDKIRGHGIPEALEAILLGRSLIFPKVAILKPLSSAISIGTGGPFGAEGPIIMTGGPFGSSFAQFFTFPRRSAKRCWWPARPAECQGYSRRQSLPCCWRWNYCCLNGSQEVSSQ